MALISLNIDLNKIDKKRIKEFTYKDGTKGLGYNMVLHLNDQINDFGNNGFIAESITKEERESGVKGTILGNSKPLGGQPASIPAAAAPQATTTTFANDLPF